MLILRPELLVFARVKTFNVRPKVTQAMTRDANWRVNMLKLNNWIITYWSAYEFWYLDATIAKVKGLLGSRKAILCQTNFLLGHACPMDTFFVHLNFLFITFIQVDTHLKDKTITLWVTYNNSLFCATSKVQVKVIAPMTFCIRAWSARAPCWGRQQLGDGCLGDAPGDDLSTLGQPDVVHGVLVRRLRWGPPMSGWCACWLKYLFFYWDMKLNWTRLNLAHCLSKHLMGLVRYMLVGNYVYTVKSAYKELIGTMKKCSL